MKHWREHADARKRHKDAWYTRKRETEQDIQSFYGEDDNYLFTLPMHWKTYTWHFVPHLSSGPRILEYGCGTAEMTKWLLGRYPQFEYTVADLAVASTLPFVRYRFKGLPVSILEIGEGFLLRAEYDFISCVEVLEHCSNPLLVTEHLYDHLVTGGGLYITYPVDREQLGSNHDSENLQNSALQRDGVINFLERNCFALKHLSPLKPNQSSLWGWDALGIYRKKVASKH
jgi:SAM-dependent methyltransferase